MEFMAAVRIRRTKFDELQKFGKIKSCTNNGRLKYISQI